MATFKCASAGKIPECAACFHGKPHEWDEGQGCANTSWCLDKIRAAGGVVTSTCACEECSKMDAAAAEFVAPIVDRIEQIVKDAIPEEGEL